MRQFFAAITALVIFALPLRAEMVLLSAERTLSLYSTRTTVEGDWWEEDIETLPLVTQTTEKILSLTTPSANGNLASVIHPCPYAGGGLGYLLGDVSASFSSQRLDFSGGVHMWAPLNYMDTNVEYRASSTVSLTFEVLTTSAFSLTGSQAIYTDYGHYSYQMSLTSASGFHLPIDGPLGESTSNDYGEYLIDLNFVGTLSPGIYTFTGSHIVSGALSEPSPNYGYADFSSASLDHKLSLVLSPSASIPVPDGAGTGVLLLLSLSALGAAFRYKAMRGVGPSGG